VEVSALREQPGETAITAVNPASAAIHRADRPPALRTMERLLLGE
jgi:hypothetical protein